MKLKCCTLFIFFSYQLFSKTSPSETEVTSDEVIDILGNEGKELINTASI